jgi:predicted DNA repair protein MutK
MAGSLLLLLDDIASALDDVATMTKAAAAKTAGVVGDDLALNAKQLSGVAADRELAVVAAVARGSAWNKCILVPTALMLGWLAPAAVQPLLMIGGAYLCFEGVEKLVHGLVHGRIHRRRHGAGAAPADTAHADGPRADATAVSEAERVRGAVRTDFILSAEIIVITLGVVAGQPWGMQVGVLAGVAVLMTVFVYGLVAAIVKLDDVGLRMARSPTPWVRGLGTRLVRVSPWLLRSLSVAGTAALFLVGGGIVAHALPPVHDFVQAIVGGLLGEVPWRGWIDWLGEGCVGLAVGALGFLTVSATRAVWSRPGAPAA